MCLKVCRTNALNLQQCCAIGGKSARDSHFFGSTTFPHRTFSHRADRVFPHRAFPYHAFQHRTMQNANQTHLNAYSIKYLLFLSRRSASETDAEAFPASWANTCSEMHPLGKHPAPCFSVTRVSAPYHAERKSDKPQRLFNQSSKNCTIPVSPQREWNGRGGHPSQSGKHMFGDASARWSTTPPRHPALLP